VPVEQHGHQDEETAAGGDERQGVRWSAATTSHPAAEPATTPSPKATPETALTVSVCAPAACRSAMSEVSTARAANAAHHERHAERRQVQRCCEPDAGQRESERGGGHRGSGAGMPVDDPARDRAGRCCRRPVADLAPLLGAAGFQRSHPIAKARADLTGLLYADGIHDSLYRAGGLTLIAAATAASRPQPGAPVSAVAA
jgi:hypothetical protein